MRISFNQGDGSFEIVLDAGEKLPAKWNITGVIVFREENPNLFRLVKDYNETLVGIE